MNCKRCFVCRSSAKIGQLGLNMLLKCTCFDDDDNNDNVDGGGVRGAGIAAHT